MIQDLYYIKSSMLRGFVVHCACRRATAAVKKDVGFVPACELTPSTDFNVSVVGFCSAKATAAVIGDTFELFFT